MIIERNLECARKLWEAFGDVPINEDEEIQEAFEEFPVGTHREEIWEWFERFFDVRVHDLMFPKS